MAPPNDVEDYRAILDPCSFFNDMDDLVAQALNKLGLAHFKSSNGIVDMDLPKSHYSLETCAEEMSSIYDAFMLLQKGGFCNTSWSALVQDPQRENVAIALPLAGEALKPLSTFMHRSRQQGMQAVSGGAAMGAAMALTAFLAYCHPMTIPYLICGSTYVLFHAYATNFLNST